MPEGACSTRQWCELRHLDPNMNRFYCPSPPITVTTTSNRESVRFSRVIVSSNALIRVVLTVVFWQSGSSDPAFRLTCSLRQCRRKSLLDFVTCSFVLISPHFHLSSEDFSVFYCPLRPCYIWQYLSTSPNGSSSASWVFFVFHSRPRLSIILYGKSGTVIDSTLSPPSPVWRSALSALFHLIWPFWFGTWGLYPPTVTTSRNVRHTRCSHVIDHSCFLSVLFLRNGIPLGSHVCLKFCAFQKWNCFMWTETIIEFVVIVVIKYLNWCISHRFHPICILY